MQSTGGGREKGLTQGLQKDGGDAYRVATDVGAQSTEAVRKNGGKTSVTGNYDGSRRADPGARALADGKRDVHEEQCLETGEGDDARGLGEAQESRAAPGGQVSPRREGVDDGVHCRPQNGRGRTY